MEHRSRLSGRAQLFDIGFALILAVAGVNYVREAPAASETWSNARLAFLTVLTVICCVVLSQRRRYPLTVLFAVAVLTLPAVGLVPRVAYYGLVIAAYSAIAYSPYWLPAVTAGAVLVGLAWQFTRDGMPTVPQQYVGSLLLAVVVLAAVALRMWRSRVEEGRERAAAADRERTAELYRAVETERSRIARELHDVITHNVSVMLIQAGAARRTLDADLGQSREALIAVEGAGRTAMAELRHVMGLLAASPHDELAPQPGVDQLAALVGRVRETGTPVTLDVTGIPRPLPAGESLVAYRVVQEALTNTVRHAAGAAAAVVVDYRDGELRIEVTDTGGSPTGTTGSGRGLLGLRERLAAYGGELRTSPSPTGGGYRVTAIIPLPAR